MMERPTSVTAGELVKDRDKWADLKDNGQCELWYNQNRVDGIEHTKSGAYIIDAGGLANELEIVDEDTIIEIEWLMPAQQPLPADQPGEGEAVDLFAVEHPVQPQDSAQIFTTKTTSGHQ